MMLALQASPFQFRLCMLRPVCATLALLLVSQCRMGANAQDGNLQAGGLIVETQENVAIEPVTAEQVTERIHKLAQAAEAYRQAGESAHADFKGDAGAAARICLLRLKVLDNVGQALGASAGAIENFRCTVAIQKSRLVADRAAILAQTKQLESEIAQHESHVRLVADGLDGDEANVVLLAKKLERLNELKEDAANVERSQLAASQALSNLRKLDASLKTYSQLMEEETLRQASSLRSSRVTAQSVVLNQQAEQLYSSVQTLAPLVKSITATPNTRSISPDMIAPELPAALKPTVTPQIRQQVAEYLRNKDKTTKTASRNP